MLALMVTLLSSPAPAIAAEDLHTILMDRIEARIALPPGAYPFSAYGRHYTFAGLARVRGLYVALSVEPYPVQFLRPGQRKWFDGINALPFIADGGCIVVTFEYELWTDRIVDVSCNGIA